VSHAKRMRNLNMDRATYLHTALRARKSMSELERQSKKAARRQNLWTVEELDLGAVKGAELAARIASRTEWPDGWRAPTGDKG
jgi:hypothetical protein